MIPSLTTFKGFGGDSEKPTWLYSNFNFIKDIQSQATSPGPLFGKRALVNKYVDKHGCQKFSGTKNLKGSQSYPTAFGQAVKKTILKNKEVIHARKADMERLSRVARIGW